MSRSSSSPCGPVVLHCGRHCGLCPAYYRQHSSLITRRQRSTSACGNNNAAVEQAASLGGAGGKAAPSSSHVRRFVSAGAVPAAASSSSSRGLPQVVSNEILKGGTSTLRQPAAADDPHRLRRFTLAHAATRAQALAELAAGRKVSAWMWYIFPTPPHVVHGVEQGSVVNRTYALRSDEEAIAYLNFNADGEDLQQNYLDALQAVAKQLESGRGVVSLLGKLSAPKLESSVRLFERISRADAVNAPEVNAACLQVLNLLRRD